MSEKFPSYGSTGLPDEYVQRIGEIIIHAAHLERTIEWCIWIFMGGFPDAIIHPPLVITASLRISGKLRLLRSLVELKLRDQDEKQEFVNLIGRSKELFRIRDQLAHGTPQIRFTGGKKPNGLIKIIIKTETKMQLKNWEISEDDLHKAPVDLMKTTSAFSKFMKRLDRGELST